MKKYFYTLIMFLVIIGISSNCYANTGDITYKAEYKDAISYKVTITGLEEKNDEYMYSAMVCQEQNITGSNFLSPLGKSFSIEYNKDTNTWEGTTVSAMDGIKSYDTFERTGQYYAYVAKVKKGSVNYEILDGPTKIETPVLPVLGERIQITSGVYGNTSYLIKVNALNTMLHNGIQRTIKFYLGEVTDETLLKKLNENGKAAYGELLQYAKTQEKNLKQDSFQDNKVGILDYNIVQNYPIENKKYYFLHSILDNENGTYIDVEDIAIYNGKVTEKGEVGLENFKYQEEEKKQLEQKKENENKEIDNTIIKVNSLPKAGISLIGILLIVGATIWGMVCYMKNKKYKDIK